VSRSGRGCLTSPPARAGRAHTLPDSPTYCWIRAKVARPCKLQSTETSRGRSCRKRCLRASLRATNLKMRIWCCRRSRSSSADTSKSQRSDAHASRATAPPLGFETKMNQWAAVDRYFSPAACAALSCSWPLLQVMGGARISDCGVERISAPTGMHVTSLLKRR
jgi:hypothetical protein